MKPKKNQKVFNAKTELRKAKFYKMKDAVKSKLISRKSRTTGRKAKTELTSAEYVIRLLAVIFISMALLPFILQGIGSIFSSEEQVPQETVSVPQTQSTPQTQQPQTQQPQPTPQPPTEYPTKQPQPAPQPTPQPTQDAPVVVNNNINVSGDAKVTVNTTVNVD